MPGEQISFYELLRILVEAVHVESVPGTDREVIMAWIAAAERVDLFGLRATMAGQIARKEVVDERRRLGMLRDRERQMRGERWPGR